MTASDAVRPSLLGDGDDGASKPFLDHLEDLRVMLIRCALALALGAGVAMPFVPTIFAFLKAPLDRVVKQPDLFLQSIEVTGAFSVTIRVGLWSGLLLSAPFLVFFIGQFIFPGLTQQERTIVRQTGGFSVLLFIVGVWLGYQVTLPVALRMMFGMHDWLGIQPVPQVTSYVAFVVHLLLAFGIAFQMPVILVVLGRLGLISSQQLRERRRMVIVILLVVAMVLTPPDIITQVIMAGPLVILYEFCIWIVQIAERRQKKDAQR